MPDEQQNLTSNTVKGPSPISLVPTRPDQEVANDLRQRMEATAGPLLGDYAALDYCALSWLWWFGQAGVLICVFMLIVSFPNPVKALVVNRVFSAKGQLSADIAAGGIDEFNRGLRGVGTNAGCSISAEQKRDLNSRNECEKPCEPLQPKSVIGDPFFRRPWVNVGLGALAGLVWCGVLWGCSAR